MKIALIQFANIIQTKWAGLTNGISSVATAVFSADNPHDRFPTIVAQTTEGQIMDGPRGLRLITHGGPVLVDQTPSGFVVYQPFTHILQPIKG
ncbi:hypothetical protein IAD21_01877 [Abditibacteriota bacterium]|nr:hypothetical protein IAD21_01877 [Abditibacteriota bacterium]